MILQSFNWRSCENKDGHYNWLLSRVDKMKGAKIAIVSKNDIATTSSPLVLVFLL